ncbi:sigma-70 family RNA polymerase sigma factor [Nocardia yunnanensis]|uniref:Sigma-70 family RNA polymerase sigma factor n=1 Tax=Nocardia yunnanensis TaxID=2382165 RepID=A0A386ZB85_9NOCA|nr:sigma-70 family RNA polymerase sigma factor [Nocardia yunnanensis]
MSDRNSGPPADADSPRDSGSPRDSNSPCDSGSPAQRFERRRTRLIALAFRMLGASGEAEDAVQETWVRLSRTEIDEIRNLDGWLTTTLSRICLDALRTREVRREYPLGSVVPESIPAVTAAGGPEDQVVLGEEVERAVLVLLRRLAPAERVAFVLHDLFEVPFDEIATILDRSPNAARLLASKARHRVLGDNPRTAGYAARAPNRARLPGGGPGRGYRGGTDTARTRNRSDGRRGGRARQGRGHRTRYPGRVPPGLPLRPAGRLRRAGASRRASRRALRRARRRPGCAGLHHRQRRNHPHRRDSRTRHACPTDPDGPRFHGLAAGFGRSPARRA